MTVPRMNDAYADSVRDRLVQQVEADAGQALARKPGERNPLESDHRPAPARLRRRSRWLTAQVVTTVVIVLGVIVPTTFIALNTPPHTSTVGEPTTSASTALQPAAALVGLWKVDAPGEGTSTWVRFTPRDITIERGRDLIFASWVSGDSRMAVVLTGWGGGIKDRQAPWLEHAASFERDGNGMVLLGAEGQRLAVLRSTGSAPEPRNAVPEVMNGRTPRSELETYFSIPTPAARPGPALTEMLIQGRWRTGNADVDGKRPYLTLNADGTYKASDGCNGTIGRWLLLPENRLTFTSAFHSATACENLQPVYDWTDAARTASVINDRLTLFDRSGTPLGSFDRN